MFSKNFICRAVPRSCVAFLAAVTVGGAVISGSVPAAALGLGDLAGGWSIPDTNEKLTIRNGEWFHPKFGRAKIRVGTDSADIAVFYEGIETKCSYRVSIADSGNTLILATSDTRQDGDRCPVGRFKRVER